MSEHARPWSRRALEEGGFTGFVPVGRIADAEVPEAPGVYAVLRSADPAPRFAETNPAGRFRKKDPTVEVAVLEKAWVEEPEVLYVASAADLRKRLEELRRFAAGEPVGHWGGRYLWQLEDRDALLVAWNPTHEDAAVVETRMLGDFKDRYRALPFANLRR
ncbi:hypothetical protein [Amnibacterium setariae]|uniref:Uncharacterized protein n=1 Tax=Amnibacterium setariae TaxID=2306585 RepID=A0A3A1TWE7_9MICO|nr:hypothetical protein [Amnibacterium setariae]RIX27871.1 hypothetical protein D1781_10080 [Amnibacterium setariae]